MSNKVVVIDYGIGNIFSICNAFKNCGADVVLSSDIKEVENADRLVLPGVGAFKDGMDALVYRGFDNAIKNYAEKQRPFLGICLGMQVLFSESHEFGIFKGLGIIPGKVLKISLPGFGKIPHIGWSPVFMCEKSSWEKTVFDSILENQSFYFVHSFYGEPQNQEHKLAVCRYEGVEITAAVAVDNIYGCQFHPEKSGENGLKIINSFLNL